MKPTSESGHLVWKCVGCGARTLAEIGKQLEVCPKCFAPVYVVEAVSDVR